MLVRRTEDRVRIKRERVKQAISLAMESHWEEAASVNRLIVDHSPDDVEAHNRLGKALSELGQYKEARKVYKRALQLAPNNGIARKNLQRIEPLREDISQKTQRKRVPPHFFIEETGKTGSVTLVNEAPEETLAKTSAGEPVALEFMDKTLQVTTTDGEYLGSVDPKIALKLIDLSRGGNRYAGAISRLDGSQIHIFIKETYQHPSQKGRLSFQPKGVNDFRPYVWEGLYRFGADDDDASGDGVDDWVDEQDEAVAGIGRPARRSTAASSGEEDEEF